MNKVECRLARWNALNNVLNEIKDYVTGIVVNVKTNYGMGCY